MTPIPREAAWVLAVVFAIGLHVWAASKARRMASRQVVAPVSPEVAA